MANVAKKAIIRALVDGVLTDLMVKTNTENVWVDESTTLSAKLSEIMTEAALHAKKTEVTEEINAAINGLINGAPETYNTLKEISDYIAAHEDVVEALNAAIGAKASQADLTALQGVVNGIKSTVDGLGALATKDVVAESDLGEALASKINGKADKATTLAGYGITDAYTGEVIDQKIADAVRNATGGESAATVKQDLETYKTSNDARVKAIEDDYLKGADKTELQGAISSGDEATLGAAKTYADGLNTAMDTRVQAVEAAKHEHGNKAVLDGITSDLVTEWNSKGTTFVQASEPANLAAGDLFIQLVD